jgi:nicotinamidase-related amidase
VAVPKNTLPWDDVLPREDLDAFAKEGFLAPHRSLSAGTRPALIIVDMTREFVDSRYLLGYSPTGYPAVSANARLLTASRAAGIPIYFTKRYADINHELLAAEWGRWKLAGHTLPTAAGSPPADIIVDELAPLETEIVITKGSKPSAFFGTPLASLMIYNQCDTAIVTGMTTSGCVRATVVDAFQYNFHCVVPIECCADRSQMSHKVNLFDMHMKYADVVSVEETIKYVGQCAATESITARISDCPDVKEDGMSRLGDGQAPDQPPRPRATDASPGLP